jgi:hypothetical protein
MSAKTNDTIFLAIGGFAILGAGVWAFVQQSSISELRTPPLAPSSGAVYEPSAVKIVTPESRSWADAPAQKAGEKWIYDVFTPPKIYYNIHTKQFTVVPPTDPVQPVDTKVDVVMPPIPTFGLELVKVEQPLFRLQLIGNVGEGDQARGNFLNVRTGTVVFGTTGKKLPDLKLEIVRFSAERKVVPQPGGTTLRYLEVTAIVRDTETGVETPLDLKRRVPEGPPIVVFKTPDGAERTAKSGDKFTVGEDSYTVGELVVEPPSAVVTREGPSLPAPETKTLVIPPPAPPPPDSAAPSPEGGATPGEATTLF